MLGSTAPSTAQAVADRGALHAPKARLLWLSSADEPVADHMVRATLLDWNGEVVLGTRQCRARTEGSPTDVDARASVELLSWKEGRSVSQFESTDSGEMDWFAASLASTKSPIDATTRILVGRTWAWRDPGEVYVVYGEHHVERLMEGDQAGDNLGAAILTLRQGDEQFVLVGAPGAEATHLAPTAVNGAIHCLRVISNGFEPVGHLDGKPLLGQHLESLHVATPATDQHDWLATSEAAPGTGIESVVFLELPGLKRAQVAQLNGADAGLQTRIVRDLLRCDDVDRDGVDDMIVNLYEKQRDATNGRHRVVLVSAKSGAVLREWPASGPDVLALELGTVMGGEHPAFVRMSQRQSETSLMLSGTIELCDIDDGSVVTLPVEGPDGMQPVALVRDGRSERVPETTDFGVVFARGAAANGSGTWLTRIARVAVNP